jgi:uncharacterized protein (TIGR02413 family)
MRTIKGNHIKWEKEEKTVTLTIFFFTISIKRQELTLDEAMHREAVERRMQESMDRYIFK